ncbi:hypothetical protein [Chondromyces crocatus]|uniref:Abnormal spindle-like microcephaly-associated protein ASH domain-containing protein n=1 Tax=Chondromyces crocatus TaxID=52 RepID=A0A0K1E906_CHOCO|nr:hypothetical protein [Chondromyces crocatus]AKT37152.1 uncharacterized protein CMC5_012820 [Chondromyces crocatus]
MTLRHGLRIHGLGIAALTATLVAAGTAEAQTPATSGAAKASSVVAEAHPAISLGAGVSGGWNQILVRVQNQGQQPARGQVAVSAHPYSGDPSFEASAPYSVGPGASVHVRVPVLAGTYGDVQVRVGDDKGEELLRQSFTSSTLSSVVLFDIEPVSRLRTVLNESPISLTSAGSSGGGRAPTASTSLLVSQPHVDPATGDPMLPDRPALYAAVDVVLIRSDTLARLHGAELDALAGFVLAGGTIALTVTRPEDLRSATLISLVGGEVSPASRSPELAQEIPPPLPPSSAASRSLPPAPTPTPAVAEALRGWQGGNLRPSPYGNASTYGLGEVHLLAFDPGHAEALSDPWIHLRMIDLARRAHDRRTSVVFRQGAEQTHTDMKRVRQQLDPNESTRWALGLSVLLLGIYAIVAGPMNFMRAAKKQQPLRALWHLPIYAAVTFGLILAIGVAAKGVVGRARHLTLVEAGAGMTQGTARRFRGFFTAESKGLTVRTTDASSVMGIAVNAELAERREKLVVDRDGARLVDVVALPWQTVVVREDGFSSLGEGISILPVPGGGATVTNRSGRDMRAVLLWLPDGMPTAWYFDKIEDGAQVASSAGTDLRSSKQGLAWLTIMRHGRRSGIMDLHDLNATQLAPILDVAAPRLSEAWRALENAAPGQVDWFPTGVPTLLAQLDGGEGRSSDTGLRLESDRLLVRVVGWGGRP